MEKIRNGYKVTTANRSPRFSQGRYSYSIYREIYGEVVCHSDAEYDSHESAMTAGMAHIDDMLNNYEEDGNEDNDNLRF